MGGYVVLSPKKGLITSAPTFRPSSKPVSTPQPSLIPTADPSSRMTSSSPFLSNASTFPTNVGPLTRNPSHQPTPTTPSKVPTINPSLSPTFRQRKSKTVAPTTTSVPTLFPTYRRTSIPSQVPTRRPTKTTVPSFSMTRSPSTIPTLPLPPSVIVSSLTSNLTTITQGGIYSTSSQSKCCSFLISTSEDVTITPQDNDGCKHHYYKILPLRTVTSIARQGTVIIKSFNIQNDIIDLTAFTYLHNLTEVSYSNFPVTILLSSSLSSSDITQLVILPSLSSFNSLTSSNLIFTSSSGNEQGGTSVQLFTENLIIAFTFSGFLIVLTVFYAFSDRIVLKKEKKSKRQQKSSLNRVNNNDLTVIHHDTHHIHDNTAIVPNFVIEVNTRRSDSESSKHEGSVHIDDFDNSDDSDDSDASAYNISNDSDEDDNSDFDALSDDLGSISNLTF
eukprot:gene8232-8902_t